MLMALREQRHFNRSCAAFPKNSFGLLKSFSGALVEGIFGFLSGILDGAFHPVILHGKNCLEVAHQDFFL